MLHYYTYHVNMSVKHLSCLQILFCQPQLFLHSLSSLMARSNSRRISAAAALVGGLLGIKPVMHVDNEGKLAVVTKVRGRRTSLQAMADKIGELGLDPKAGPIFISHGDCADDVEVLKKMIKDKYRVGVDIVSYVGTVIGAHSGPGTIALFFLGTER